MTDGSGVHKWVWEGELSERGSVVPILVVGMFAAAFSMWVLVGLSQRAIEAAEAQTAADMAALAGVFEGRSGAADLAERNGAELVRYEYTGEEVHVIVRLGAASAGAYAVYENRLVGELSKEVGG